MPTYEYECLACGSVFEQRQNITAAVLTECPECRGQVRRLISGGTGFILKGPAKGSSEGAGKACALETTGMTCCGRETRCESPGCDQ
jgi:putative FmdB family regulatory protein